ncbi:MAG TPA: AAA family ATPase [Caulobacteraceae bacterium]|jgi:chromosome partitioning protein
MRTIAVIGRKGGSGKTTVAVHLAIGLHLRGRRTVVADIDPQRSAMDVLRARQGDGPVAVASAGPKLFSLQVDMARAGNDALVIDTPAVLEEEVAQAVVLADLALLVVRPTFLDLAAAVRTSDIIRRLRKPGLVVLSQAPVARGSAEAPAVVRATEALRLLRLPIAPSVIRARAAYQTVVERGRSTEELTGDAPAALEMSRFCDFVDRFAFAPRHGVIARIEA